MTKLAYILGARRALEKLGTGITLTLEQTPTTSRLKISGTRVPVTSDQTPQAETWKATNAEEQQRSVDSAWEQHDKRQQLFTRPLWPD